jgi:hypothetical protein
LNEEIVECFKEIPEKNNSIKINFTGVLYLYCVCISYLLILDNKHLTSAQSFIVKTLSIGMKIKIKGYVIPVKTFPVIKPQL